MKNKNAIHLPFEKGSLLANELINIMKLTSDDTLSIIRQLYEKRKEPLDLNLIHNSIKHLFKDAKPSEIGKILKYLHQSNKIEMIGDRIKPRE